MIKKSDIDSLILFYYRINSLNNNKLNLDKLKVGENDYEYLSLNDYYGDILKKGLDVFLSSAQEIDHVDLSRNINEYALEPEFKRIMLDVYSGLRIMALGFLEFQKFDSLFQKSLPQCSTDKIPKIETNSDKYRFSRSSDSQTLSYVQIQKVADFLLALNEINGNHDNLRHSLEKDVLQPLKRDLSKFAKLIGLMKDAETDNIESVYCSISREFNSLMKQLGAEFSSFRDLWLAVDQSLPEKEFPKLSENDSLKVRIEKLRERILDNENDEVSGSFGFKFLEDYTFDSNLVEELLKDLKEYHSYVPKDERVKSVLEWLCKCTDESFEYHHNPKDVFIINDYKSEDEEEWNHNWKPQIKAFIEEF